MTETPPPNLIQVALEHHKAGRLAQAEATYRQILQQNPDHPDALYLLGALAAQTGHADPAIELMTRSLRLRPLAPIYYDLGNIFQRKGRQNEALECYDNALKMQPDFVEVLNNRGNLLQQLGQFDEALADYDHALKINPQFVLSLSNRGNVLQRLERTEEALDCYRRAMMISPDYAEAYYNYGYTVSLQGDLDEAIKYHQKAISLKPDYAEAYSGLANILRKRNKIPEAIQYYREAIKANPQYAEAYNNLGNAFKDQGHYAEALVHYRKTLELKPDNPETHYNIGQLLRDQAQTVEAIACYDRALALRPLYPEARWSYAMTHIPLLLGKHENLPALRDALAHQLDALDRWFNSKRTELGYQAVGTSQPFYLAYQEENNRKLLEQHGALCVRLMKDWQKRKHFEPVPAVPAGPIRLGIVSAHVHNHSVWHALVKGWLQHLNRDLIEIHIFSAGLLEDDETRWAMTRATSFQTIGKNLDYAVTSILAKNLDVLIYPEIGMEPIVQQLASLRLCPAQLACWGHPETSGLSTIDYFLSADDFEPDDAINNYSELLIRLPHLGCCYTSFDVTPIEFDFATLGIKPNVPLLLSPGVPFKYAPQHDHVFIDIARRLGSCQIIFFISRPQDVSEKLKVRMKSAFEKAGLDFDATCLFIPWLERPVFYSLMKKADVFLDTIGFSGFNTAMQAVECALPIVTREGRFMRGRLASGILKRLGLAELIATDNAAYVDLAIRLANDKKYQQAMRQHIIKERAQLFGDKEPVQALQDLIVNLADRL